MKYLLYFLLKSMTKQTENTCYTNELGADAHKRQTNINNLIPVLLIWVNIFPRKQTQKSKYLQQSIYSTSMACASQHGHILLIIIYFLTEKRLEAEVLKRPEMLKLWIKKDLEKKIMLLFLSNCSIYKTPLPSFSKEFQDLTTQSNGSSLYKLPVFSSIFLKEVSQCFYEVNEATERGDFYFQQKFLPMERKSQQ